jgi:hypothetical protein
VKKIWVLALGIVLLASVASMAFAGGDAQGPGAPGLKEVRVDNALWAWDPSVLGFMAPQFSNKQCFLLTVESPLKEYQGEQIGNFLDQAGSTFELVAAGKPEIKAAVFEVGYYLISGRPASCFALVIKDQEFSKMEPNQPYLLKVNQENRAARWVMEKDFRLTKPSRMPQQPAFKARRINLPPA